MQLEKSYPFWPVLQAIHFASDRKLYITYVGTQYALMGLLSGVQVVAVTMKDEEIRLHGVDKHFGVHVKNKDFLSSKNPRYIIKQLNDKNTGPGQILRLRIDEAENVLPDVLTECAYQFSILERKTPKDIPWNKENWTEAAETLVNGGNITDVSAKTNQMLHDVVIINTENILAEEQLRVKSMNMFNKYKWVIGIIDVFGRNGYIIGCINTSGLENLVNNNSYDPTNFYLVKPAINNAQVPFSIHESIEEAVKTLGSEGDNLMASLTFAKMARSNNPNEPVIPINTSATAWLDTESLVFRANTYRWFMVNRL